MKIRLTTSLPLPPEHGAKAGREFEVSHILDNKFVVTGDAGETVHIFGHECEITDASNRPVEEKTPPPAAPEPKPVPVYTDAEKLQMAGEAIEYLLIRIDGNAKLAFHFNGTESLAKLTKAYAAVFGKRWEDES